MALRVESAVPVRAGPPASAADPRLKRRWLRGAAWLLAAMLGVPCVWAPAWAATVQSAEPAARVVAAAPLEGPPPRIDGRLGEPAWAAAPVITGFTQRDPIEGAPPSQRTEIRILFDDHGVYVAARMYDSAPDSIVAHVTRRDQFSQSDWIILSFDSYRDRRTAYEFALNPAGVQRDRYRFRDAESHAAVDRSWDAVWEGAARVDSLGWTAEFRIPYSQLRFAAASEQVWGFQVNRFIVRRNEDAYLVHVPKTAPGWVSHFVELRGIRNIAPPVRMELRPYTATIAEYIRPAGPADPFNDGSEHGWRAGADLKLGLGPNLTLDATVNPDFGQVEADTAVVNLSAFEVRFEEKRPFFLEGRRLFETREHGIFYFYSRRVGAPPQFTTGAEYDDAPRQTTILGAGKLTGRLPDGTSLGALLALTGKEEANSFDAATGTFGRARVQPLTAYAVGRLLREFGASASTVGAIFTAVRRDLNNSPALASFLPERAYTGGLDWNWRLNGGEYRISGSAGFSRVHGSEEAVLRLQRSSSRYFQRPDADHVELDPSRTSLSGYLARLEVAREAGRHWLWRLFGRAISPGFELNDAGFVRQTDWLHTSARLQYRETRPQGPFRSYSFEGSYGVGWNFGGVRTRGGARLRAELEWPNFWRTNLQLRSMPEALSDNLTRGGPLMRSPRQWQFEAEWQTNSFRPTFGSVTFQYNRDDLDGYRAQIGGQLRLRPASRWELLVGPRWSAERVMRQYVWTLAAGPVETFGSRYIFAQLDRREFAVSLRLNYGLTSRLSLALFAEPFVSAGRYADHGELRAPRTDDLLVYGTEGTTIVRDDSRGVYLAQARGETFALPILDFGVRSFRSNLVVRWEFRPGSWLYLVWQQNRFADRAPGELVQPADLGDVFGLASDDILLVKVSYWLSQ